MLPALRRHGRYGIEAAAAPTVVPADQLLAAQQELLDTQRKLIDTQERLLAASGGRRKHKAGRPLTSDDIAQMRALRAQGLPITEIARRMQRSSATVSQMCREVPAAQPSLFGGAA